MTRIIPAYAGSTPSSLCHARIGLGSSPHTRGALSSSMLTVSTFRDHPRIRGEHAGVGASGTARQGIIPAYAGSTMPPFTQPTQLLGSSPHTRGALLGCHSRPPVYVGSSPHTRGARFGLIPRSAGRWDHPRIRGEHSAHLLGDCRHAGIIPAYAGSTPPTSSATAVTRGSSPHTRGARPHFPAFRRLRRDHPRIRGEHVYMLDSLRPPLRIIPAYAGSTLSDLRNYTALLSSRFGCQGTITHQHAASATLLSPKPSCRPILTRVAPSLLRHPKHRRVISP